MPLWWNNDDEDLPPSYYEVVGWQAREEIPSRYAAIFAKTFLIVNSLLACFSFGGFILIMFTDTFPVHQVDVTKYCDHPDYNINNAPQSFGIFECILICLPFLARLLAISANSYKKNWKVGKLIIRLLWNFSILVMQLIYMTTLVTALKLRFGIPRPHLFGIEQLKDFYCGADWHHDSTLPSSLEGIDYKMRTSFPSFRSSLYAFTVSFLYLYIDRLDIETKLHLIQQLVVILLGSLACTNLVSLWENGDNHLADILVGAAIGIVEAAFTIRSIFGTVFRKISN